MCETGIHGKRETSRIIFVTLLYTSTQQIFFLSLSQQMENYNQAHRIIDEIQESLFCRLESCRDTIQAQAIEGTIDERLKQIEAVIEKMEIAVNKATTSQRTTLKFKLDQLRFAS